MSRFIRRFLSGLGVLLVAVSLSGCSGDGGEGGSSGDVAVLHNLSSNGQEVSRVVTVGPEATNFTFTGMDANGSVLYGPDTRSRANDHLLVGVPEDVVSLEVEYRTEDGSLNAMGHRTEDGSLNAMGHAPVKVVPGDTVTVTAMASKELTVLLVNESGVDDDDVYVLLSANGEVTVDKLGGTLAIYQIGKGSNTVTSSKLSSLHKVGTLVSPFTGKTNNVYGFNPTKVVSGRLWISYNNALTYQKGDTAPTNFENVRYDKMEMGYNPASGDTTGYFDLTAVDFFGIPMQLEVMANQDDGAPFRTTTFYTSTPTLLNTLYQLDQANMANAFYEEGATSPTPGWIPGTDKLSTFLRIMSPSTLVSVKPDKDTDPFSAAPYPSFRNYLTTQVNNGVAVNLEGENGVDGGKLTKWYYQASIASDGDDGFVVTCKPTQAMSNSPEGSIGDGNYPVDPTLPPDLTVELPLTKRFFDQFIYGVPANSFTVNELDCYLTPYAANSVYANIAGNFLAGLNFGYVDGLYGDDATHWFDVLPGYAPYGAARKKPDDGYYSPYAAVLYNLSDAYSFSISDRLKVGNPLVTTSPDKPYLRITILPDERLDAPQSVSVTPGPDGKSLQVQWDPVEPPSDFTLTGYKVTATDGSVQVVDPTKSFPTKVVPNQTVVTTTSTMSKLTGLSPGASYQVSVVSTGKANGAEVRSAVGMSATVATAAAKQMRAANTITYQVGVSPGDIPDGTTFWMDGKEWKTGFTVSKPKPGSDGSLIRSLFQIKGPDQEDSGTTVTYAQTNILLNAFDAGGNTFNVYFNFPFSSTVPKSGTDQTTLSDGSKMSFAYSSTYGPKTNPTNQPPFGDTANSLVVSLMPSPTNAPKTYSEVTLPSTTPVTLDPNPPSPTPPDYNPPPHTPVPCPTFTVQAVLGTDSPVKSLSELSGATVQVVRLVTIPTDVSSVPARDGSGADAAGTLNKQGSVEFDPSKSPYNAPIWKLGYRVNIIYKETTYSAYGAWKNAEVGSVWKSGLTGEQDKPGVIYVPVYPDTTGDQVVWGN
jgi:hypothetical protein